MFSGWRPLVSFESHVVIANDNFIGHQVTPFELGAFALGVVVKLVVAAGLTVRRP